MRLAMRSAMTLPPPAMAVQQERSAMAKALQMRPLQMRPLTMRPLTKHPLTKAL